VVKSLASALSIGTGAAVGREGPIIQIGAALGSAFSQAIRLANWQKVTLLSAGAGAGMIGRMLIGPDPAFAVPDIQFPLAHSFSVQEGLAFVILGALCGLASWTFIRMLVVMEDVAPRKSDGEKMPPEAPQPRLTVVATSLRTKSNASRPAAAIRFSSTD
jgi:chloride channel protein, CIC family